MTLDSHRGDGGRQGKSIAAGAASIIPTALAAALGLALAATAAAAPVPNAQKDVRIAAREENLDRVLEEIFRLLDVPVAISPKFQAASGQRKVNGDFAQPADMLLQDLARTYQFVSYYDGTTVHVVGNNEVVSRSFALGAPIAEQIMQMARTLDMADARHTLRRSFGGTLIATGSPRFVQQIEEMTRQARAGETIENNTVVRTPLQDYRVFYLRYAWAQDTSVNFAGRQQVIPGVANILRSLVDLPPSGTGRSMRTRSTVPSMREQNGMRARDLYVLPMVGRDTAGDVAQGLADASYTSYVAGTSPDAMEPGQRAPGARIEADPRLNAVIVRDTPDQMGKYQRLIAALDVEPQALEIEATIIDVDTERSRELGINWRYNRGSNSVFFASGDANSPASLADSARLRGTEDPTPFGIGGFASAILGNRNPFVIRIKALQAEGAAKVVSSPQVVTLSNVEAVFDNSTTFYVRTQGSQLSGGGDLYNITAGTNLRVTPHVFKDENGTRIKLLAQIEDGEVLPVVSASTGVEGLPFVKRSSINTQALINEGESLLIGGMVRDTTNVGEQKVPLLGDIPLLGNLFKTQTKTGARLERLFLITPRLSSNRSTRDVKERMNRPLGAPPMPSMDPVPAPEPAPAPAPAPAPESAPRPQ
jgi:type III secretion protein C